MLFIHKLQGIDRGCDIPIIDFMAGEFLTKKGLLKLQGELEELVRRRRPQVAERLKEAVSFGDLSENAEYAEAKEEQAFVEGRISEIENILRTANLVSEKRTFDIFSGAEIGCVVEVESNGQFNKFKIVGKGESNPAKGHISSDSPIGQALLGKVAGEEIDVLTPVGNKRYKIVRIADLA